MRSSGPPNVGYDTVIRALRARNLKLILLGGGAGNGVTARRFRQSQIGAGEE
jgi:hypothetical protein